MTNDQNKPSPYDHKVVSPEEWFTARLDLLKAEKEFTRQRVALTRRRMAMPWERVEKSYRFEGANGALSLADLFDGRSQLIVYHFMFHPDWREGCPSCSYVVDHLDGTIPHLAARDVSLAVVSRAPLTKIDAFKKRMGWRFLWVSSFGSDFNYDYHVSFTPEQKARGKVDYNYEMEEFPSDEGPGTSVFYKDPETADIFHTYSTYARGLEPLIGTYTLLDFVPKGRDEDKLSFSMGWLRHHDRYGTDVFLDPARPYWPANAPLLRSAPSTCGCGAAEANS